MPTVRRLRILPQPDDTTCGPTCLHALYSYYGDDLPLDQVVREVVALPEYGTLAVLLACHALRRGYDATIYTYNLHVFDPSWFRMDPAVLPDRLRAQREAKADLKLHLATDAYLDFLSLGGELQFRELTPSLIRGYLEGGRPILTGLSATYLYGCPRERGDHRLVYDDILGRPTGHFVVLTAYDREQEEVLVADPLRENPRFEPHYYPVGVQRVLGAILLGVLTYDANFLVVRPRGEGAGPNSTRVESAT
jgi:hypothetical protein